MKLLGKILLTVSSIFWLLLIVLYFFIQSPIGIDFINQHSGNYTGQQRIILSRIEHSFSKPYEVKLLGVKWLNEEQNTVLLADQLVIGLGRSALLSQLDYLIINGGWLNYNMETPPLLPINRLQMINSRLSLQSPLGELDAEGVYGGLLRSQESQFTFSARKLKVNSLLLTNGFIQGRLNEYNLLIDNVGADLFRGSFIGKGRRNVDDGWLISNLQFNDIRWQTDRSWDDLNAFIALLPNMTIKQIELTNGELESPNIKANQVDASLNNLILNQGIWSTDQSTLLFNAANLIYHDWSLVRPSVDLMLSQDKVQINHLSTYWQEGLISTKGEWLAASQRLQLDDLLISGVSYTLPNNFTDYLTHALPDWLNEIYIQQLKITPSLLLSIDPKFPFQFTHLRGSAQDLLLAKQQQAGVWAGKGSVNADNASINTISLRHLSANFLSTGSIIAVSDVSALNGNGVIDVGFKVGQLTPEAQSNRGGSSPLNLMKLLEVNLVARSVSSDLLNKWRLVNDAPLSKGDLKLILKGNKGELTLEQTGSKSIYPIQNQRIITQE